MVFVPVPVPVLIMCLCLCGCVLTTMAVNQLVCRFQDVDAHMWYSL